MLAVDFNGQIVFSYIVSDNVADFAVGCITVIINVTLVNDRPIGIVL